MEIEFEMSTPNDQSVRVRDQAGLWTQHSNVRLLSAVWRTNGRDERDVWDRLGMSQQTGGEGITRSIQHPKSEITGGVVILEKGECANHVW